MTTVQTAADSVSTPIAPPGEPTRGRLISAFAGTALVITAPSAAKAENPDAELIAASKRFAHFKQEYGRL